MTCVKSMESISFLDVTVYKGPNFIRNGTLDYRTHIKVTNIRSYVHSNSYHARGTRKGIIVGEIHRYHKTNPVIYTSGTKSEHMFRHLSEEATIWWKSNIMSEKL